MKTALTYWLFVLLPTLLLGGLTLFLWFREMERTVEEREALAEARVRTWEEAAAGSAAAIRLNFEEVRKGLQEVLREESVETLAGFPERNDLVEAVQIWFPGSPEWLLESTAEWEGLSLPWVYHEQAPARDELQEAEVSSAPSRKIDLQREYQVDAYTRQQIDTRANLNTMARQRSAAVPTPAPAELRSRSFAAGRGEPDVMESGSLMEDASLSDFGDGYSVGRSEAKIDRGEGGWFWSQPDGQGSYLGWWREGPGEPVLLLRLHLDRLKAELATLLPLGEDKVSWSLQTAGTTGKSARGGEQLSGGVSPGGDLSLWRVVFQAPRGESLEETYAIRWVGALGLGGIVLSILLGAFLLRRQVDRAEREARQKTGFVALVSHELRTPLTSIRLYAEMLDRGKNLTDDNRHKYQQTLLRESSRLERMVGHLLRLSSLDQTRKPSLRPTCLSPQTWLEEILDKREEAVRAAGMTLRLVTGKLPDEVNWDADVVEQILTNLIDNAVKHATSGKVIEMIARTDDAGSGVELRVTDRGPGIPVAFRKKMFERFTQAEDSLEGKRSGLGLGLAIARQLARAHQGELWYEDHPEGGAVLVLLLPSLPVSP